MCGPGSSNHRPGRALLGSSRKPEVQSHGCVGRQRQWASQACRHLSLGPRNLRWGPRAPLQKLFPILATDGVGSTRKFLLPSLCSVSSGRGGIQGPRGQRFLRCGNEAAGRRQADVAPHTHRGFLGCLPWRTRPGAVSPSGCLQ